MHANHLAWKRKKVLRHVYYDFYRLIQTCIADLPHSYPTVEIGCGIGTIRDIIPSCLTTDLFKTPWAQDAENAYSLSFGSETVGNLILFDVFHHLRYPGDALKEFWRVLTPGGRVILFEPGFGLLGKFVYQVFHREQTGLGQPIEWTAKQSGSGREQTDSKGQSYYAAQANAWRIFQLGQVESKPWKVVRLLPITSLSYIASGGFQGPQLYPSVAYPFVLRLDQVLQRFPNLFATRLLIVLEKCL
ncbi:MAG: methyltransferase domain-containing protein [Verrucomicrobia bacterium]|nr:methyltransferase domain-containing protein [Verrucomicrobiota bacterium]